jgi:hypothetical protein
MASFMICHARAFAGRDVQLDRASDSHANRGMNKVANAFLASDCDVWINLDADIHFTPLDVENLLSHCSGSSAVPLVYGLYPKKQDDAPPCIGTFDELPIPDARNLATVRRCGRGFMLVKRELLEAMKEDNGGPALRYHNHGAVEWDFFPSGVVTGAMSVYPSHPSPQSHDPDGYPLREWISEDWFFCERARALGVPTLVDVRIALGHEGSKVYRFSGAQLERTDGWHAVPGWFSDADAEIYRRFAKELPDHACVAEIGCWLGRSLAAFSTFLVAEGKAASISAIDTFQGTPNEGDVHYRLVQECGGSVRGVFESTMREFGMAPAIYEMDSTLAAHMFCDATFDAIFIDGDHIYEAVRADLRAWLPKLKPGGLIGGHDYDYDSVHAAVREVFPFTGEAIVERIGRCWFVRTCPHLAVTITEDGGRCNSCHADVTYDPARRTWL